MKAVQVDFYILSEQSPEALLIACRIAEKAWRNRYAVQVNVGDEACVQRLDELMWTYRQDSFLPHEVALPGAANDSTLALPTPPVRIAPCDAASDNSTMLINVAGALSRLPDPLISERPHQLERIAEVVAPDNDSKTSARERYRRYREHDFVLQTHDV